MADLSDAIAFDMDKEYTHNDIVYPACTACPHKNQTVLFDDVINNGTCLDGDCFRIKERLATESIQNPYSELQKRYSEQQERLCK